MLSIRLFGGPMIKNPGPSLFEVTFLNPPGMREAWLGYNESD
jgi:hypothetical protein